MAKRPIRLLEKMRKSKGNCTPQDLEDLYLGFGFVKIEHAKHTFYQHPVFKDLAAHVARHKTLAPGYYSTAVHLIDELRKRERQDTSE